MPPRSRTLTAESVRSTTVPVAAGTSSMCSPTHSSRSRRSGSVARAASCSTARRGNPACSSITSRVWLAAGPWVNRSSSSAWASPAPTATHGPPPGRVPACGNQRSQDSMPARSVPRAAATVRSCGEWVTLRRTSTARVHASACSAGPVTAMRGCSSKGTGTGISARVARLARAVAASARRARSPLVTGLAWTSAGRGPRPARTWRKSVSSTWRTHTRWWREVARSRSSGRSGSSSSACSRWAFAAASTVAMTSDMSWRHRAAAFSYSLRAWRFCTKWLATIIIGKPIMNTREIGLRMVANMTPPMRAGMSIIGHGKEMWRGAFGGLGTSSSVAVTWSPNRGGRSTPRSLRGAAPSRRVRTVSPSSIGSPQATGVGAVTLRPAARVPCAEPTSRTRTVSESITWAWVRLTSGSLSRMPAPWPRPIVTTSPVTGTSRPASGPETTCTTARGRVAVEGRCSQSSVTEATVSTSPSRSPASASRRAAGHGRPSLVGARRSLECSPARCAPSWAARSATEPSGSASTTTSTGESLLSLLGRTLSRHIFGVLPLGHGRGHWDRRYGWAMARSRLSRVETSALSSPPPPTAQFLPGPRHPAPTPIATSIPARPLPPPSRVAPPSPGGWRPAGDEARNAVQDGAQPEGVGTARVGRRAVLLSRRLPDPGRDRVAGRVQGGGEERPRLLPPVAVCGRGRLGEEQLASAGPHVVEHQGERAVDLDVIQPGPDERTELGVVLGDGARPQRRPRGVDVGEPAVPEQEVEVLLRDPLQPCAPVGRVSGTGGVVLHLGEHLVHHEFEQLGLAGDVAVEGHRPDAQPLRKPAHRQLGDPGVIGQLDPGRHDRVEAEAAAPRPHPAAPQQWDDAQGICGTGALDHLSSLRSGTQSFTILFRTAFRTPYGKDGEVRCNWRSR